MVKYFCLHTLLNISPEHLIEHAENIASGVHAKFISIYINYASGKVITMYDAPDKESVTKELRRVELPPDSIHEVEFFATGEDLLNLNRMGFG